MKDFKYELTEKQIHKVFLVWSKDYHFNPEAFKTNASLKELAKGQTEHFIELLEDQNPGLKVKANPSCK